WVNKFDAEDFPDRHDEREVVREVMKIRLAELIGALLFLYAALVFGAERPIRIVYPGISIGAMVPALAIEKGFFQQEGLQVEFIVMPAATGISALIPPKMPVGDIVDFHLLREARASAPRANQREGK